MPDVFVIPTLAQLPAWFVIGMGGLVGLLVGSFLNVVIHRLPRMIEREEANYIAELREEPLPHPDAYNLVVPRSACPSCGHQIKAVENIPVVSWLALRGRCSACKTSISWRYPAVELVTGLLTGACFWHFGPTWVAVASAVLLWFLVAGTMIDADTQLLPDAITQPLLWLGLGVNLFSMFAHLHDAVIGAMAGYLFLWSIYWAYKLLRGREGMGYGDFKLMAALGAWFGWQALPLLVLLSSVVGLVFGLFRMARGISSETPFSFGPFIAGAGVIALLAGPQLVMLTGLGPLLAP
ncbi:bacterial Peptidase A24 N-terminal domain protein [Ralstonia insidiosa]|uniref:Prepilin leader peptidase/N-methyltransferase n=1 Tax=Ralstonia insidiosa TaxID=190721 RepID=A0AAC9BDY5_9RALS|nr:MULTISPECIES: A24 family peptidase [Ralstonia]ANH71996.1 bacterial Peptidase A24 N-terminal domain protein [Ralstonia insidiosa]EPX96386.1 methyltransferase [Ralstonia sp. AU12-08]MBY4706266.1 A24 family peptidase [Ralstonia insidiosa]GAQ27316.1 prepilin peptidase [Ralstonia sp. NT80]